MKILGILNESDPLRRIGCTWYRCIFPLQSLTRAGLADVSYMTLDEWNANRQKLGPTLSKFDLVQFQRIVNTGDVGEASGDERRLGWEYYATGLRSMGVAVVLDYDDDYTGQYRPNKRADAALPDLNAFSCVTVSTDWLWNLYRPLTRRTMLHTLPNVVVRAQFQNRQRYTKGLTIGLTGSESHKNDWDVVAPALRRIVAEYSDVRIFVAGYVPEALRDLPNLERMTMRDASGSEADAWLTFTNTDGIDYGLVMAQIDILLCPVDPADKFSWGRSNIKALEGWCAAREVGYGGRVGGCAVIVTDDVPCYAGTVKHGVNGLRVKHHDGEAWYQAIRRLVTDTAERARLQEAGYRDVGRWVAGTKTAAQVASVYETIIRREKRPAATAVKAAEMAEWVERVKAAPAEVDTRHYLDTTPTPP